MKSSCSANCSPDDKNVVVLSPPLAVSAVFSRSANLPGKKPELGVRDNHLAAHPLDNEWTFLVNGRLGTHMFHFGFPVGA